MLVDDGHRNQVAAGSAVSYLIMSLLPLQGWSPADTKQPAKQPAQQPAKKSKKKGKPGFDALDDLDDEESAAVASANSDHGNAVSD